MAMPGKSASGKHPALSAEEAEAAAETFRPSWAADDEDTSVTAAPAPELLAPKTEPSAFVVTAKMAAPAGKATMIGVAPPAAPAVRAPMPTEPLDSSEMIEIEPAAKKAEVPSTTIVTAPPVTTAPEPVPATDPLPAPAPRALDQTAKMDRAPAVKREPIPFPAGDPFRAGMKDLDFDLPTPKKSSKGLFAVLGMGVLAAGVGLFFAFGKEDRPPPAPSTVATTAPAKTDDIPPPPPKEEAPAKAAEAPAKTAEPAPKAPEPKPEHARPEPKPTAFRAPAPPPRAPAAAPPPPKTAPKATTGGIVRDSPF